MRSLAPGLIPGVQYLVQTALSMRFHAFIVQGDRDDVQASGSRSLDSVHVTEFFDQQSFPVTHPVSVFIPSVAQGFNSLGKPIGIPTGQDDFGASAVRHVGMQVLDGELTEKLVEWRVSLGNAILKGSLQINLPEKILVVGRLWHDDTAGGEAIRSCGGCKEGGRRVNWVGRGRGEAVGKSCCALESIKGEVVVVGETTSQIAYAGDPEVLVEVFDPAGVAVLGGLGIMMGKIDGLWQLGTIDL